MFCTGFGARCVRVDKVAVFSVPLSTYFKIRYASKFTAASRGSPCDSTAFLSVVMTKLCSHHSCGVVAVKDRGSSTGMPLSSRTVYWKRQTATLIRGMISTSLHYKDRLTRPTTMRQPSCAASRQTRRWMKALPLYTTVPIIGLANTYVAYITT